MKNLHFKNQFSTFWNCQLKVWVLSNLRIWIFVCDEHLVPKSRIPKVGPKLLSTVFTLTKCRFSLSSRNSMDLCGLWWWLASLGVLWAAPEGDWGTWRALSVARSPVARGWPLWFRLSRLRVFFPAVVAPTADSSPSSGASRSVSSRPTGRSWQTCIVRDFAISMAVGFPRSVTARLRDAYGGLLASAPNRGGCGGNGGLLYTGGLPFALLKQSDNAY